MNKKLIKPLIYIAVFCAVCFALFLVLDYAYPLNKNALKRENSVIIFDKHGKIITMRPSKDEIWRFDAKNIPKVLKDSVLLFEDRYFYYHFGFNPFSMARAALHNLTHKNRIGASTITMQVARMMSPKERTYTNKIKEIFTAFQLEWHYTKDEILKFYFNLAPYGGNIEGVGAAARFYFNKNLEDLSIAQMTLLSTIPKNPNANRLDKKSNINSLKNRVVKLLYEAKVIDKSGFNRAKQEPFKNQRFSAPFEAKQYSQIALKSGISNSNLDLGFQKILNTNLKFTANSLIQKKAHNAAGIIIDNENMSVIAYVGSHDERALEGQNDGVLMSRNVGSTLKPFIFSLGLDEGIITPKMQMIDTEIFLGEYVPKNYDNEFLGLVSATEALALSLNIPSVNLNNKLGENSLYELLKRLNLVQKSKEFYGESIALGSAEMSLLNLAHLYTIYANEGRLKPLEVAGKIIDKDMQLISPQSAFLTAKMLSSASRAYLGMIWQYAKDTPQIAFKTGTSYGSRDIYAIGVNKNYTVAVWFGNFNGKKTDNLSGIHDASRAVFDIFKLLAQRENLSFINRPENIAYEPTCLDAFAFKECRNKQEDELIKGVLPKDKCKIIRSEEIAFLLKNNQISKDDLLNSPCYDEFKKFRPLIAAPFNNQILLSDDNATKVVLKCYAYIGDEIYYKLNQNEWQKSQNGMDNMLFLDFGKHKIGCLDENSNLSEVNIEIRRF
ncbi:penicillin-binding protein 1C [Campylobacter sp. RM16188]|uniref:penicillin-binding protein 1C n=1 Tax=Campylobacter sp. RM16188 TaxID=1705725 RepID=UPI001554D23C|nr:penicillin-binding protein 1C [Campylobacter sp. RM16188]